MRPKSLVWLLAVLVSTPALASKIFVGGLAPNWDQPYDYPDPFDAGGPGADPNPGSLGDMWDNWCVPASAAMLLGHWEDALGKAGLSDGSADGNQAVPNTYGGPSWMSRNWHDRTADGSVLRGSGGVEDLGWYMDTNNTGDTSLTNGTHNGTLLGDVATGMNNFFSAVGNGSGQPAENLAAATEGVNATFGGLSVADLVADLRTEIDSNRTAIAHFQHWNLINGPGGPGQGSSSNDSEDDFEDSGYDFGEPSEGDRGEEWNGQTGADFLGHSVLVVGYETDMFGNVTHLIVHDNWPTTVRNVKVPVGNELVAITTVVPEPGTLVLIGLGALAAIRRRKRIDR